MTKILIRLMLINALTLPALAQQSAEDDPAINTCGSDAQRKAIDDTANIASNAITKIQGVLDACEDAACRAKMEGYLVRLREQQDIVRHERAKSEQCEHEEKG